MLKLESTPYNVLGKQYTTQLFLIYGVGASASVITPLSHRGLYMD